MYHQTKCWEVQYLYRLGMTIEDERQVSNLHIVILAGHCFYSIRRFILHLNLKVIRTLCLEYRQKFSNWTLLMLLCIHWPIQSFLLEEARSVDTGGLLNSACWTHALWQTMPYQECSLGHCTPPATWLHLSVTCNTSHRWRGLPHPLETSRQNLTQRAVHVRVWLDRQILRIDHRHSIECHASSGTAEALPNVFMLLVLSVVVLYTQLIFLCEVKCRRTVFISKSIWWNIFCCK
jgi:hypothetical protein